MLGGWANSQGLRELRGGRLYDWDRCGAVDTPGQRTADFSCYEGRRPDSMIDDSNTYFFDFNVFVPF